MYATIHRTEQWFSHHHLALGALIALLAVVIIGLARSVTLYAPAPTAPAIKAPSAAYSAAVTRYQVLKAAQAEAQDRTAAVIVPGPRALIPTAEQRYLDFKERQAETQDRTTVPSSSAPIPAAQQRYQNAKKRQAEMQDRAAAAGPTAAQSAQYQMAMMRLRDLNTRGDPELDAGLLPGAYADARSGPH